MKKDGAGTATDGHGWLLRFMTPQTRTVQTESPVYLRENKETRLQNDYNLRNNSASPKIYILISKLHRIKIQ